MWLGEFDVSSIVDLKFTTRGTTGAPTTLSGSPAVSVYKANGTTESTSGVTLTVDFDARTGLNHVRIDTSSDGTFYATGNDFQIVITAGTVGGTSVVGEVVGHFTLRNRAPLKPSTAGRTIVIDASGLADANMVKMGPSGSGTAQTARDIGASVLLSSGTGTGQVSITSGIVDVNLKQALGNAVTVDANNVLNVSAKYLAGTALTGRDIGASVLLSSGTGTGQLSITAGVVAANATQWGSVNVTGMPMPTYSQPSGFLAATFPLVIASTTNITAASGVTLASSQTFTNSSSANQTGDSYARLGAPAGASLAADIASVKTDTGTTIPSRLPAALSGNGNMKADVEEIAGNTGGAARLDRSARGIATGTVGSGSTTTSIVTSAISPSAVTNSQFLGRIVIFDKDTTTAALRGQATDITASTSGGVLTVSALTTAPVSGDTFTIT